MDETCVGVILLLGVLELQFSSFKYDKRYDIMTPISCERAASVLTSSYCKSLLIYWCYNPVWVLASSIGSGGFVTVDFSRMRLLARYPTPNLEGQGLHFVWPLPFYLSGMGGPTRSLLSHQHSSPGHWGTQTSQ
jgi:hypothetical protein